MCSMRECSECGSLIHEGYMVDDGSWYCCEYCMNAMIILGLMRESEGGEENELGGFYDELIDDKWEPTGVYWTDWSD